MRYPIMTINGTGKEGITEITATVNDNTPEYLSKKPVTGIALYIERWDDDSLPAMSILISPDKQVELLCNKGFSKGFVDKMISRIEELKDDICDYIEERESVGRDE